MQTLKSKLDNSINYVYESEEGKLESRYVERDGYFICYLSSHNGCNRGCKFCHLTATNQLSFSPASPADFRRQAIYVLNNLDVSQRNHVHFNFMARGEPMMNPSILNGEVFKLIDELSVDYNFTYETLISTIMPKVVARPLCGHFRGYSPNIYYSWYSSDINWRRKWLPAAGDWKQALHMLSDYYYDTGIESRIHFALIKDENDTDENIQSLLDFFPKMSFTPKINLVQYNSPDESKESERYGEIKSLIEQVTECKIIPRVGYDVKASCGMFVQ